MAAAVDCSEVEELEFHIDAGALVASLLRLKVDALDSREIVGYGIL